MTQELRSLKPVQGSNRGARRRLTLRDEFALAMLPTAVVLLVFALVEELSNQRLLFASLASSAFLIYLDPQHGTNRVRTLVLSQMLAAVLGFAAYFTMGAGYWSGGAAMLLTISAMIMLDAVHPPAVSTSLAFAFRAGDEGNLLLFALAVGMTATLVVLQGAALWLLVRLTRRS